MQKLNESARHPTSVVYGWAMIAAAAAYYVAHLRGLIGGSTQMTKMAGALGMDVPFHVKLCGKIGDPWLSVIPIVLLAMPVFVMLRARSSSRRIVGSTAGLVALVAYITIVFNAFMMPLRSIEEMTSRRMAQQPSSETSLGLPFPSDGSRPN